MSQLYVRVFLKILDSSIAENFELRHVFEDFLKLSDDGVVDMTREAISRRLNIPFPKLNEAISKLEAPDPKSRNPDHEGRRLLRLDAHRDWGWVIVNWDEYDRIRSDREVGKVREVPEAAATGGPEATSPSAPGAPFALEAPAPALPEATKAGNPKLKCWSPESRAALAHLNEAAGRHFRETDVNLRLVQSRLDEVKGDLLGVRMMIDRAAKKWRGTEFAEFLRPETLFCKSKFGGYYDNRDIPVPKNENDKRVNPRNVGTCEVSTDFVSAASRRGGHYQRSLLERQVAPVENLFQPGIAGT